MSDFPLDRLARLRLEIQAGRDLVKDRIHEWQENIDYRVHRNTGAGRDAGDVTVPIDWSMTKQKHAQLFSRLPEVRLTANPGFEGAVSPFAKLLNKTLKRAGSGAAMNEILPDVINAAGIGAVIVCYESRTETRSIPKVNPALVPPQMQAAMLTGQPEMVDQEVTTDKRFYVERFSPADLIIHASFTGSDFDQSPLIGRRRRTTWPDLKRLFKLDDSQRELVEKEAGINTSEDRIQSENNRSTAPGNPALCSYTEVFYRRYFYHEDEPFFDSIQRVVFVDGIEAPVVDEPWTGQKLSELTGEYVGSTKYPIRVLTLTYVTDDAVPPSDSAMGRGQVVELNTARSEMQLQRKHSKPLRWADSNRLDADEMDKLARGEWNDFIFTKGPGDHVIGEVARAAYPNERFEFDRVIKDDLYLAYQTSPNQLGAITPGETTAAESNNAQSGFATRVNQERAMVTAFYAGVAEVMAGLLSLYGDFAPPHMSQEEAERLEPVRDFLSGEFAYTVRPHAAVMIDAKERYAELKTFVDMWGQSGYAVLKPIAAEMAELLDLDPLVVVTEPAPKEPEPLNISIRSSEDLMNPMLLALLFRTGQAPRPEDLQAAKSAIDDTLAWKPTITTPDEGTQPAVGGTPPDPRVRPGDTQVQMEMMPTVSKRTDML